MVRPISPNLVGRERELGWLHARLAAVRQGRPVVAVVAGEAGVGKSRTIEAFSAHAAGARTLVGHCVPVADGELPFAPFVEAFRQVAQDASHAGVFGTAAVVQPSTSVGPDPLPLAAGSEQSRLFEATLEVIGRLASAEAPLVLVLEDLHWADRSSRELVLFLARNLRAQPVMLTVSYRSDELHRRHPLLPTLAELDRLPSVHRLELLPLEPGHLMSLLRGIAGPALSDPDLERIAARSGGIPFHAEELVAAAADGQASGLTTSLRDTLTVRLAALPEETQRVIRIAAAIGRRADHALLREVTRLDDDTLTEALRAAVDRQVIDLVDDPEASRVGYEFRHALLGETAYAELLPAERSAVHAGVAAALEGLSDSETADAVRAAEIAYHWDRAGDAGRALGAAVAAGRAAETVVAHAEALGQFRRALELWQRVPRPEAAAGLDEASLLVQAASAARSVGDPRVAARLADSALDRLPRDDVDGRINILELLHLCRWEAGDPDGARAALEAALDLAPARGAPRPRARILAYVGWRALLEGRMDQSRLASEESVALARGAGDVPTQHLAEFALASVLLHVGEVGRSERILRRLIVDGDVSELPIVVARHRLGELLVEAGRMSEAAQVLRDLVAATQRAGLGSFARVNARVGLAGVLVPAGEWEEADAVLTAARADDGPGRIAWPAMYLVWLHVSRGELEDARRCLDEAEELVGPHHADQSGIRLVRAMVAHADGRFEEGRRAVAEIIELNQDLRFDTVPLAIATGMRIEADAAVHASARRDELAAAEARRIGTGLSDLMDLVVAQSGERGRLATLVSLAADVAAERTRLEGVPQPAAFAAAARAYDAAGRPFDAARCRLREAEAMLVSGGRRSAARGPLLAAHGEAVRLGARGLLREVRELARRSRIELEADPSPRLSRLAHRPTPADPHGLTAREQAVLRLLSTGMSNRQIADRLFITESTAGVHVSNVIGKLGVAGRAGAAAIAVRLGLTTDDEASIDAQTTKSVPR